MVVWTPAVGQKASLYQSFLSPHTHIPPYYVSRADGDVQIKIFRLEKFGVR